MFKLSDRIPQYLLEKPQLSVTVIFTVLFSVAFLIISVPFSNNAWFDLGANQAFAFTVLFFFIAILVIVVSKRLMNLVRSRGMSYLSYILWNAAEVVIISLLYAFFTVEGGEMGFLNLRDADFDILFGQALVYVTISLGVPYTVLAQYFAIEEKNNTIRMMDMGSVVTDLPLASSETNRITLYDNNGMLKLSIKQDNLYFIEADDNYIQVWYTDNGGQMKQYMLRCRLKTVEDSFHGSDLVRCHRKYIVNMSKVSVLKSEDKGYMIDLDIDTVDPIPVSKTYEQAVLARFNSR